MRVRELAEWLGAAFEGDGEKDVTRAAALESAGPDELSFAAGRKALKEAAASAAGCLIVDAGFTSPFGRTLIRAADPRRAFARAVARLHPARPFEPGIHPSAVVASDAVVSPEASIGPGCVVGARSTVGAGTRLHANVTVYHDVEIGARCIIHSGVVLGADGFGFIPTRDGYEKFPQVGRVFIGDDVEIGAQCTVDRAALGVTRIEQGAKLDNMVHVGHNCRIGRHVIVVAQTGFAGGVVVDDWAVVGGQVGVGDYARIESGAVIGSGAGILSHKIVHAGTPQWGTPARPLKEYLEQLANLARLPALRKEVAALRRKIEELEAR